MDVVLFDQHSDGHHLEYAGKLLEELAGSAYEVSFLGVKRTDRHATYFPAERIAFLAEEIGVDKSDPPEVIIESAVKYATDRDTDILHFLQIDDILGALYRVDTTVETTMVGELNGGFFRNEHLATPLRTLLKLRGIGPTVAETYRRIPTSVDRRLIPDLFSRTVGLYGCLSKQRLDHIFVHSQEAADFLEDLCPGVMVSTVPDPTPILFEDGVSKGAARERLDLPDGSPVLLFFGQLRDDKGIDLLLSAIEKYDGPPFTMVIAGPEDTFGEDDIAAIDVPAEVTVRADIEFVSEESVPLYFRAADAVVVPYRRSFGAPRTSGVFQKACGAGRPIIAPDFGTLGNRVRERGLGATFKPNSASSLAGTMSLLVEGQTAYKEASIREYARNQTFERLAQSVREGYPETSGPYPTRTDRTTESKRFM